MRRSTRGVNLESEGFGCAAEMEDMHIIHAMKYHEIMQ